MNLKPKPSDDAYSIVIFCSALIGTYLFFRNPQITEFVAASSIDSPYVFLSQKIFEPNYSYVSESILLPLLAKLIGANNTVQTYSILCAALTLLILPTIAYINTNNLCCGKRSLLTVILFATTFEYLSKYWLGFPDPLTIICIATAVLSINPGTVFLATLLAGLSHFSMTTIAMLAYATLLCFSDQNKKSVKVDRLILIGLSIIISKFILIIWYQTFDYHLTSRVDIIFDYGVEFFITRYREQGIKFWLTPGGGFLATYFFIAFYFCVIGKLKFAIAMIFVLLLPYLAVFLTIDGLRVFAVTVCGAYLLALREFVVAVYPRISRHTTLAVSWIGFKLDASGLSPFYSGRAAVITGLWYLLIVKAKSAGFFVNESTLLDHLVGSVTYLQLILFSMQLFVFVTLALPSFRQSTGLLFIARITFYSPLLVIGFQYLRSRVFALQVLSDSSKLLVAACLCLSLVWLMKINVVKLLKSFDSHLNKLIAFISSSRQL